MISRIKSLTLSVSLIILVLSLTFGGCDFLTPSPPTQPPPPTLPSDISEQPDLATFGIYFTELYLTAQTPKEGGAPPNNVFRRGETMFMYGVIIREGQLTVRYYDVEKAEFVKTSGQTSIILEGKGFLNYAANLDVPAGRYEVKCYIGETLIYVLPFEVRE